MTDPATYNITNDHKAVITQRIGDRETVVELNLDEMTVYDVMAVLRAVRDGEYVKKPASFATQDAMPYLRR